MSQVDRAEHDLGMLLAACCERMVRNVLGELATAGYGHLTPSQSLTVLFIGDGHDTVTQLADRLGAALPTGGFDATALTAAVDAL